MARPALIVATAAWLCCGLGACAAHVAQAPFPGRPDTVQPGDLLGPFSGQVLDAATGNPVPGALLLCSWAYQQSPGLLTPVASRDYSTLTRPDGGYDIPRGQPLDQAGALLRRFTLIVYKAGYLGYRSDVRFDDRTPRHDFAQRDAKIRLDRFPDGESHARHLAFLGGGMALQKAAQAEVIQAGLELSEAQAPKTVAEPGVPPPPLPQAEALLTIEDLQKVTGTKLKFEPAPLPDSLGAADSVDYGSTHLRAVGKDESFDAALRLWRPDPSRIPLTGKGVTQQDREQAAVRSAEALYDKLRVILKVQDAHDKDEVGDRSLRALDTKRHIRGAAALVRQGALLVEISCGANLCKKDEQAVHLLSLAVDRLNSGTAEPPPKKPEPPQQLKLRPLDFRVPR
jgi:hypothetical protein